jgi:hypothetical protein
VEPRTQLKPGDTGTFVVNVDKLHVFDGETGLAIRN